MSKKRIALLIAVICVVFIASMPFSALANEYVYEYLPIPASLLEAFEQLNILLESEDIDLIKNSDYDDLILFHFGLGRWIRNNWIFPENSPLTHKLRRLGHFDNKSQFIIEAYHHYLNGAEYADILEMLNTATRQEFFRQLRQRSVWFLVLIVPIAAIRYFGGKIKDPAGLFIKTGRVIQRLNFLRITFVLFMIGLSSNGIALIFNELLWYDAGTYAFVVVLTLALPLSALFCFRDMTKKQIAVSAILPTVYYIVYGLNSNFFAFPLSGTFGRGAHGFFWDGWRFIFPTEYIVFFCETIGFFWPRVLNSIFMLFPFVYVLLAKSKKVPDFSGESQ